MRRQGCCKEVCRLALGSGLILRARFRFEREDTRSQEAVVDKVLVASHARRSLAAASFTYDAQRQTTIGMAVLASLGRGSRDRLRRASNLERPCARDPCVAPRQCGNAGASKARLRVQSPAWVRGTQIARQRRSRAGAAAPSSESRRRLCRAETDRETLHGSGWNVPLDRSSRLGVSGRDIPHLRPRVEAAGPAGVGTAGRTAADLCLAVRDAVSARPGS